MQRVSVPAWRNLLKTRLDVLLVEQGYFESRVSAQRAIMAGMVFVDGQISDKPGTQIKDGAVINVKGDLCPYVSRGGYKLEKALDVFGIAPDGWTCIDIGSSTGGFTDCLLQRGAAKVYAVDVGTNQLAWKLRSDERVVTMEQYNFRYAVPADFADVMDFACTDVSFISLKLILPPAASLLKEGGLMVALIKPQFEAGKDQVGKHGIVKDPAVHEEVIRKVLGYAYDSGFSVLALDFSPVKGAKEGNIEYLVLLRKEPAEGLKSTVSDDLIVKTVNTSHRNFEPAE